MNSKTKALLGNYSKEDRDEMIKRAEDALKDGDYLASTGICTVEEYEEREDEIFEEAIMSIIDEYEEM